MNRKWPHHWLTTGPFSGFGNIHLKPCVTWDYSDIAADVIFLPEWEKKVSKGLGEVCVGSLWWLFIITLKCDLLTLQRQNPVVSFHLHWDCNIGALDETILPSNRGYGFICHRKCPFFRTQPHSFLLLQQCPNNHALPPPVSRNLILMCVPSSQSSVHVCLTNSALLLILPVPPYRLAASQHPPPRPGKGFVLWHKRRIYFPSL